MSFVSKHCLVPNIPNKLHDKCLQTYCLCISKYYSIEAKAPWFVSNHTLLDLTWHGERLTLSQNFITSEKMKDRNCFFFWRKQLNFMAKTIWKYYSVLKNKESLKLNINMITIQAIKVISRIIFSQSEMMSLKLSLIELWFLCPICID